MLALAIPLSPDADLEREIQSALTRMWTAKARKDYAEAGRRVAAMEHEKGLT